ncbi:MAG TPA: hypothetical protein VJY62_17890 [Bacteroidia bacterium]|nr:hypothetical protein [Bacteroidia bacterium]
MFKYFGKDSFLLGIITGLLFSGVAYYTYINYNELMSGSSYWSVKLYPPRLQLILLALTLVLFRFMMVRWNMIKTGQGLFLSVFIITIIYFFNHRYKIF